MDSQTIVTIESGKSCPTSGMWKIVGTFTTTATLTEKTIMPTYCGVKVFWTLLYHC